MGIIVKQSIKGTFWSYAGVVIGFVTTGLLFPRFLSKELIGLLSLLISFSVIFTQLSTLGINGVTARLFPYFRNSKNNHNGYLFISSVVILVGFTITMTFFGLFYPQFIHANIEKSELLSEYAYLIAPLTFFALLFNHLDIYNKLLYNAVLGTFLQEFIQRFLLLVSTLLFIFDVITIQQFILLYVASVSIKAIIIFIYLLVKGNIDFTPNRNFISPALRKEMVTVAFYNILTGLGANLIFQFDKIIINSLLGIGQTGVYTIAFFFGSLVIIPSRSLLRISGTLIAEDWKKNDVASIATVYKKSCITQYIIALFVFGGIWLNIDNILFILGNDYMDAKWVIFFISLGYVVHMGTGVNDLIIAYSKHYRVALWFNLIMIATIVVLMYLLIPIWGIVGAAISVFITFLFNNLFRFIYLLIKYKMQPFNISFIYTTIIILLTYTIAAFIPQLPLMIDVLLRSLLFTVMFWGLILHFNISNEITESVQNMVRAIQRKIRNR